ncbi:carboxy terminal-processing peptidase [Winogradskyella aurantiaca]|uniref:carboxy terminal-processing peptidase n=1 Tax=Winogradskyella aurantiaca TaxID=2219558 RepID=UPI000E1C4093|nr:carboxy terminal-processing peptidase [Winogradskyella aurantiaca]
MKGKFKFMLLAMLIAFASCSFTTKTFDNPDRDKLLVQLISYVLEQGHFSPKDLNDEFSEKVFYDYLEQLDPFKRYFYKSDIKEFEAYKLKIDDQIKTYDLTFFNLTHDRLLQRIEESKGRYVEILDKPFDYSKNETFSTDYEALEFVKNKREMKERWRQQLKFSTIANYDDALNLRNSLEENPGFATSANQEKAVAENMKSEADYEAEARETTKRSLEELYTFIDERQRNDWFAVYINAIVEEFDPHTFYFAPQEKERFDVRMTGQFEGIGARLQKRMDVITVNEIISGGPAWRQNDLKVGDQILKVRQEDEVEPVNVVGMRLDDAIKFIKGPKGTKVTLTVRKVDGEISDITITRDVVQIEETYAKSSIVEKEGKNYGVINLPGFYADLKDYNKRNAASDVKKEIERLKEQGMQGLVIDLRDNGGGSLQTVVDMAGLFIKNGPVVQVKTTGEPKEVLSNKDNSILWDGPLVILVNELSASASEILAAAMQDYKRAIVLGSEQTYGKGTVQQVLDLNRMVRNSSGGDMGALKFTTQKYYRINGGSTQLEGVKSDIVVPDRYMYIGIGERTYDSPMAWDKIDAAEYEEWENYFDYEATIEKSRARMADNEQLKLIDENAKWINDIRENNEFSLKYDDYKARLEANENYAKRFDKITEYQNNLTFESLPYEIALMEQDTVLKEKRGRWHKALSRDVYVDEAINVLQDLKMTYKIKNNLATTVKE